MLTKVGKGGNYAEMSALFHEQKMRAPRPSSSEIAK